MLHQLRRTSYSNWQFSKHALSTIELVWNRMGSTNWRRSLNRINWAAVASSRSSWSRTERRSILSLLCKTGALLLSVLRSLRHLREKVPERSSYFVQSDCREINVFNDELEALWKETVMAYFKIPPFVLTRKKEAKRTEQSACRPGIKCWAYKIRIRNANN
jgi:hypothetical protein